jgi:CRISPR system Cascade subunit CasE
MSEELLLVRARLRRDVPAASLARLLVPEEPGAQIGAAHRLVWALFADSPDRRRDFLWRKTGGGNFLILTSRPPSDPHNLFALEWKQFAPNLRPGQRLGFDLRANPVTSVLLGPHERGKRADVVMHALHSVPSGERAAARGAAIETAGAAWLARQGARAGFSIEADALRIDGYETVRIPRGPGQRPIAHSALEFQGAITVQDPARFLAALPRGFGAAKAFGCGLMLIRRARG